MLLVTLLVIGIGVFVFISRNEQRSWQGRQKEAALYAGEIVTDFIQRARDILILASILNRDYLEAEPQMLRLFLDKNPALLEVIRMDESGRVVASIYQDTPVLVNLFTIPQSSWFLAAKAGDPYLSRVQISAGNEPYLIMAIPAPDGGVVAARLRMDVLWDTIADIRFGEGGQAYVIDQKGEIIAHPETDVTLAKTSLEGRPEMIALSQASNYEWNGLYENFEGIRVRGVTASVSDTDWVVITELPQSEALAVSRTALLLIGVGMSVFGVLLVLLASHFFVRRLVVAPIEKLRAGAERLGRGSLSYRIDVVRHDEIGELAGTFNQMAGELQELYEQNAARTRDLERRARYLQATAEVARDASSVLDLEELLSRVVILISGQFGFYHTGIFLLDPTGEWAVLQAASSEGGQRMLTRGHRLRVGEVGIVGYVTSTGEPRVALDVGADAVHFDNPNLPSTRSEMALPLRARGKIIGALDVQSTEPEAFSDEDMVVLQTLADQVAMAINNAQLFQQVEESLEMERRAYGEVSRGAWRGLLRTQSDLAFLSDERGISPCGDLWEPQMETALRTGKAVAGNTSGQSLAVPIKVRGQIIGVIDTQKSSDATGWTPEEITLTEALSEQLGMALESARLYQDIQRRAERERLTGQITARMREALDIDIVLQTAVREMGERLGIAEVEVRMTSPDRASSLPLPSEPNGDDQGEDEEAI